MCINRLPVTSLFFSKVSASWSQIQAYLRWSDPVWLGARRLFAAINFHRMPPAVN